MFFGARVHDAKVAGAKGSNCCERQLRRSMGKGEVGNEPSNAPSPFLRCRRGRPTRARRSPLSLTCARKTAPAGRFSRLGVVEVGAVPVAVWLAFRYAWSRPWAVALRFCERLSGRLKRPQTVKTCRRERFFARKRRWGGRDGRWGRRGSAKRGCGDVGARNGSAKRVRTPRTR